MFVLKLIIKYILFLPRVPILIFIKIYQKTFSPDHGLLQVLFPYGYCRFHPSCSEYGYQVIKKTGLIRGLFKTIWRILRCNPWSKGGVDMP